MAPPLKARQHLALNLLPDSLSSLPVGRTPLSRKGDPQHSPGWFRKDHRCLLERTRQTIGSSRPWNRLERPLGRAPL